MTDETTNRFRMIATNLGRNPAEFIDRVLNTVELYYHNYLHNKPRYDKVLSLEQAISELGQQFSIGLGSILHEEPMRRVIEHITGSLNNPQSKGVRESFNADFDLGRLCYILCRIRKPKAVVETGVANGVTSAFILQALSTNGVGELHSIDLPPLAVYGGSEVGSLVPGDLRHRWQLHLGSSRRLLPPLVKQIGSIDFFVHDSLHSYHNVKRELRIISKHLAPDGAVVVDNIAGNSAFTEWTAKYHPRFKSVVRESKSILGFALR